MIQRPVAGIDPSLTRSAIAAGEFGCKPSMSIVGSSDAAHNIYKRHARYEELSKQIIRPISEARARLVVIEGYSYGSRGRAMVSLGEFGYAIRRRLVELGNDIFEIPPKTLKKFVTGKGNASKAAYITACVKRYGCEYEQEDEYFAYGLQQMGFCLAGYADGQTVFQRDIIAGILK